MMNELSLSFRIVEPMMFRGPGEFDPFVRGIYSRALSLSLPTPSTIAGSLATYCISQLGKPIPKAEDWIERYREVLGDATIRGPLLEVDNELFVEDKTLNAFLSIEELKEKCHKEYEKFKIVKSLEELDKYLELKDFKSKIGVEREVRVGVALDSRDKGMKVAKIGYLYGAEYINYRALFRKKNMVRAVEILADLRGGVAEELIKLDGKRPIKLGGELRIALLAFKKGLRIIEEVKKRLWHNKEEYSGVLALYLATPALFKGGKEIREHVKDWVTKKGHDFIGMSGESEPIGAGFTIDGKRKPIYASLKPGSIIFIKGFFKLSECYWSGIGEAIELGYSTFIPIPLTSYGHK